MNHLNLYLPQTVIAILGLLLYSACSSSKRYSLIDDFSTAKDIEVFVHSLTPQNKHFTVNQSLYFEHPNCRQVVRALQIKPWYKSDIDGNGYNDLIIHSRWQQTNYIAVLMAFHENQYALKIVSAEGCNCARPTKTIKNALIEFFHFDDSLYQKSWFEMTLFSRKLTQSPQHIDDRFRDTLIYKFGEVIEYSPALRSQAIESLHFKTMSCLGHCPIFEMSIHHDKTAIYHAIRDDLRKGKFRTNINPQQFRKLLGLLKYIQVNRLKNRYQKNGLTEPMTELHIHFKNGTRKKIIDVSYQGTRGLSHLYNLLIDLRKNQQWEKIK